MDRIEMSTVPHSANHVGAPYRRRRDYLGEKSRRPTDGQTARDNTVQFKNTITSRVGVDKANSEFVVMMETRSGLYHAQVRKWTETMGSLSICRTHSRMHGSP